MERKYRSQKKAIVIIGIACVLLIALILYFQVRIKNVKAEEVANYEAQVAELTEQLDEMQAAYDEKNYSDTIASMKDEIETLKERKAVLLATPEPTEAPTVEPTEAPTVEPTEAPTVEPTEAPQD